MGSEMCIRDRIRAVCVSLPFCLSDGMDLHHVVEHLRVPSSTRTVSSIWINDDIRPLPPHRRTWSRWAYISFWAINQICLSNWQIGASLVAAGLSVWQSVIAIVVGKIIIAAVAVTNGYVGAEWHIGGSAV